MDSKRFEATLARANQLGVQAIETREQAVDTGLLLHLSDIGVNMARNLDPGGAGRTPGDLVAALVSAFVPALDAADSVRENPALFDWAELGLRVAHAFRRGVGMKCMLGPLQDAKPKEKRNTQRRARDQLSQGSPIWTSLQPGRLRSAMISVSTSLSKTLDALP